MNINNLLKINYTDVKHISSIEYFNGNKYSADLFDTKYCFTHNGIIETPADVFYRISTELSKYEKKSVQKYYRDIWFSLLWDGWFRPGGSVIAGIKSNSKVSLMNCTTVPLQGDSLEHISKCDYDVMKCAAFRQGLGVDVSSLRPRGSFINNAAMESTGVVTWVTKIVENGNYVGQKGRKPAILISLKDHHPDIIEFITSKVDLNTLQNANISVQLSDKFMDAVIHDDDWNLYFKFNGTYNDVVKTIKARDIFDIIVKTSYTTAEPGIQFVDQLREGYMVHQIYKHTKDDRFKGISSNACSEKFLAPYGVCNLMSINMDRFSTNVEEYTKELESIVPLLVRMADNVISYELENNLSPLKEQRWIVINTREIGMGITNIHAWLLNKQLQYDSDEAIDAVEQFYKTYAVNVFLSSIQIGKEKGSAKGFTLLENAKPLLGSIYFKNMVDEIFNGDYTKVTHMRNLAHMSIAPTGSISSTFPNGNFSSGIEPTIGPYYWRRTRAIDKGTYINYFILQDRVKNYVLNLLDKKSEDYKTINEFPGSVLDNNGEIGKNIISIIDSVVDKGFFKHAHLIDINKKVKLMGRLYKWTDASISCTYNLPLSATIDDVRNLYIHAYKERIRAVSIYVEGTREGILIFDDPLTNKSKILEKSILCKNDNRPEYIIPNCAPKRPHELPCDIIFTSIKGEKWVVLVGLLHDKPYEVFCGPSDDLYIPKKCSKGIIRKQTKGKYELEIKIRKVPVIYKDLASTLMNSEQRAMTRLISLSLRHGVLPNFIVGQLKKCEYSVVEFLAALCRVLSKYVSTYSFEDDNNKCPICGESSMVFIEGCSKCENCSYSKCE